MDKFIAIESKVIPLPYANVDTDQIIPARFLKGVDKASMVNGLFAGWRYGDDGAIDTDFVLNQSQYEDAQILLTKENFGCGSSREHAVWALSGWGIRAVIAPTFADIFRNNALKNGLLPIEVNQSQSKALFDLLDGDPGAKFMINLPDQKVILPDGSYFTFEMDGFAKHCLLNGQDQLGYLLAHIPAIEAYERKIRA